MFKVTFLGYSYCTLYTMRSDQSDDDYLPNEQVVFYKYITEIKKTRSIVSYHLTKVRLPGRWYYELQTNSGYDADSEQQGAGKLPFCVRINALGYGLLVTF